MPLPPKDIEAWARAYIEARESYDPESGEDLPWAIERFMDLDSDPEDAWKVILRVLDCSPSEQVLSMLAASELEDLIEDHGMQFIERIESEARASAAFKQLLCGVWPSGSKETWARVEAARGFSAPPWNAVLCIIDRWPSNPAIPNQAAVLSSVASELSDAMLANGYLTNSPFCLVGVDIDFEAPASSHGLSRDWRTSGMNIGSTIAFSRATMTLLDRESQRVVILAAVAEFLCKLAIAFGLPSGFLERYKC